MSPDPCVPCNRSSGFTLIEVIAALVIFAGGVLMVIQVSGSLSAQMERSAITSEIVVLGQARVDSLEAVPFASLTPDTIVTSFTIRGRPYYIRTAIAAVTPILRQIDVDVEPNAGSGPSYGTTSYAADNW